MEERPPIWRVATETMNKQLWAADKGWSSSLWIGRGANNSSPQKRILLRNIPTVSLIPGLILWYDLSNEKGTCDLVHGMLGARELTRCKLDLVGVQEVRWDKGGTVRAEDYIFFINWE